MNSAPDPSLVRRRQRHIFLMGFAAAAIPIGCQLLVLFLVSTAPNAFPQVDRSFFDAKFWPIQIVLLCLAISGNAIVDFSKMVIHRSADKSRLVLEVSAMSVCFLMNSVIFSGSLLISETGWKLLTAMIMLGAIGMLLAYRVEIEIGLREAGIT